MEAWKQDPKKWLQLMHSDFEKNGHTCLHVEPIQNAANRPSAHEYDTVHCLLMEFEESSICLSPEVDLLQQYFKEVLSYDVTRFQIPHRDSGRHVMRRVKNVIRSFGRVGGLSWIYHSGHADVTSGKLPFSSSVFSLSIFGFVRLILLSQWSRRIFPMGAGPRLRRIKYSG